MGTDVADLRLTSELTLAGLATSYMKANAASASIVAWLLAGHGEITTIVFVLRSTSYGWTWPGRTAGRGSARHHSSTRAHPSRSG